MAPPRSRAAPSKRNARSQGGAGGGQGGGWGRGSAHRRQKRVAAGVQVPRRGDRGRCGRRRPRIMDTIRYLLDRGANPEKADDNAFAPLHHAAGEGDCEMAELLLAKGVPVDPVSFGGTPLHVAAMEGHDEIVQILLENNADCNKIAPGVDTPLVAAIVGSSVKCVKLLIEVGADVNDGLITPLAAAAEIKGLTACLELLLEAGADRNVHDPFGRFPIELAAMKGSREDVEILFPVTYCIPTVPDWSIDGII